MRILLLIRDVICISLIMALGAVMIYGLTHSDPKVRDAATTAALLMP